MSLLLAACGADGTDPGAPETDASEAGAPEDQGDATTGIESDNTEDQGDATTRIESDNTLVRIGGTQAYIPTLPAFIAESSGLFEEFGVDGQVTNFDGGGASLEALAAGEVDLINYFPPGVAEANARGIDAVVVAAGTYSPVGWYLLVAEESDISDVSDLDGGDIGITAPGSTTDYYARFVAREAGITANYVPVGGAGMIPALTAGNVDAISGFPPLGYQLEDDGQGRVLVDLGEEEGLVLPDVWVASRELVEERPDVLQAALNAIYSAVRELQENREFAIDETMAAAGYSVAVAERTFDDTIMGLSPDGNFDYDQVEQSISLAAEEATIELPSAEDVSTREFVPVTVP